MYLRIIVHNSLLWSTIGPFWYKLSYKSDDNYNLGYVRALLIVQKIHDFVDIFWSGKSACGRKTTFFMSALPSVRKFEWISTDLMNGGKCTALSNNTNTTTSGAQCHSELDFVMGGWEKFSRFNMFESFYALLAL